MNLSKTIITLGGLFFIYIIYKVFFVRSRKKMSKMHFKIAHVTDNVESDYYCLMFSKDGKKYKKAKYLIINFNHILSDEAISLCTKKFISKQQASNALKTVQVKLGENPYERTVELVNNYPEKNEIISSKLNLLIQEETSYLSKLKAKYEDKREELSLTEYTRGEIESKEYFLLKLENLIKL